MTSKRMKRLASPRVWTIGKKEHYWATRVNPGPHPVERSVPLLQVVRDMLNYCDTAREGRRILAQRDIFVDGKVATDAKHPVGLMDVLSIPKTKESFRVLLDRKGKLQAVRITPAEAKWKLCRIEDKTTVRGGKVQLNMHDGRNVLLPKDKYKTGDVLKIGVPGQKIIDSYTLAENNLAMIIGGRHAGEISLVERVEKVRRPSPNMIHLQDGFLTTKDNVFIVGTKSPEIALPEASAI